jgi:hypothetical protein
MGQFERVEHAHLDATLALGIEAEPLGLVIECLTIARQRLTRIEHPPHESTILDVLRLIADPMGPPQTQREGENDGGEKHADRDQQGGKFLCHVVAGRIFLP